MLKTISPYDYEELEKKALRSNATQKDIEALAEWFEHWGSGFWNGECYFINENHLLYPVYENDIFIEWEIR